MLNLQLIGLQAISADATQQRLTLTSSLAKKIANIADIGAADSVLYSGTPDRKIETIVTGLGAHFNTGKINSWFGVNRLRADIALGAIPAMEAQEALAWLLLIQRRLRLGGRLVMWMAMDQFNRVSTFRDHFKILLAKAGYTSVIVGQVTPEKEGRRMVVATGILKKRIYLASTHGSR